MDLVTAVESATVAAQARTRERRTTSGHAVRLTPWVRLDAAAASVRGRQRQVNEDWHSALDGAAPLFVVADGVGGGAMAAQASRELVSRLHASLDGRRVDGRAIRDARARCRPRSRAQHRAPHVGAGAATVALCAGTGPLLSRWLIAWVGDCRVYRIGAAPEEPAQLLTVDDTYGHLREAPPPGGSRDDPARMVGNGAVDTPNVDEVALRGGDMLVLCSDGVHKHVEPDDLCRVLRGSAPLARRCGRLLALARARGSRDDATVLVVRREPRRVRLAGLAAGVALFAVLLGTWLVHAMNPEQIERVFGRGRLKMVTGEHVEVFREAVAPGERRRYTKRFLNTREGDFGQWTEREWRILARLIGHGIACVPDVVQFDRGRVGGEQLVQTYDAGVTVDQWATLLPVARDGRVYRHVFEDCAHWWALAHHCLLALARDPSARARPPRHQGRQRLHSVCAAGLRSAFRGRAAAAGVRAARADRLRVLARLAREPHDAAADRLAEGLRLPVAAPACRARGGTQRRPAADARARLALRPVQPRGDAQALSSRVDSDVRTAGWTANATPRRRR